MRNWIIGIVVFAAFLLSNPSDKEHLKALGMLVDVDVGETRGSEGGMTYLNYYICSAMMQKDRETKSQKLLSLGALKLVVPLAKKEE